MESSWHTGSSGKGNLFIHAGRSEESLVGLSAGMERFLAEQRAMVWEKSIFSAAC
jgi:hypothetical protein